MDNSKGLIKRFIALMLCALIFIAYTPGMAYALEEQPEETPAAEENLDTVPESETEDPGEAVQESGEEEAAPEQSLDEPEAEPEIVAEPEAEPEKEAEPTAESDSAVTDSAIIVAPAEAKAESFVPDVEVEDDLLQKYVDEKVTEELRGASGKSFSKIGKVNLEGADYKLYKQLVPLVTAVADGESDSAVFSIPLSNLFSEEELAFRLTEDDFEEPLLVEGDSGWEISEDAAESLYSYFVPDFKAVLNAMLADMPYEMYWFDKTRGIGVDYPSIRYREENGVGYLALMDNAEYGISFIVSGDYSADATFDSRGSLGTTTTNTTLTRAASSAAKNIAGVINDNNSKSDYDRLVAYKDAIIGMTDYNDDAYENNPPYGDPWQLIFVFDNDPDTKVVCEGYSKAFQYLCDNTVFNSPKIDCYTVSGEMTGATGAGAHMWNILHMNDSKNYIADITNSDTGTVGYESDKNKDPDGSWLFLNGYDSGDMNYGYVYNSDGKTIKYVYDGSPGATDSAEEDMLSVYSLAQLRMSKTSYGTEEQTPSGDEKYYLEEDQSILYNGKLHIDSWGWVEHSDGEGNPIFDLYTVTNVEITEQNPDLVEGDVLIVDPETENEDGWNFIARSFGSATLKITYQKLDGSSAWYTINVNVDSEIYLVFVDSQGVDSALPGESIELTARAVKRCRADGGFYDDIDMDPEMIKWSLDGDGSDYADIDADGDTATVTFKGMDAFDGDRGIKVDVGLYAGNSQLASTFQILQLSDDFYEITPYQLPELDAYAPEKVKFSLDHRYMKDGEAVSVPVNDATFTFDESELVSAVPDKNENGSFTLTRLDTEDGILSLKAVGDNGEELNKDYYLDGWYYEVHVNLENECGTVYTDGPAVFNVDMESFVEDWKSKYKLVATVGSWVGSNIYDEDEGYFVGETYSSEDNDSGVSIEFSEDWLNAYVTVDQEIVNEFKDDDISVLVEMKPIEGEYTDNSAAYRVQTESVYEPVEEYYGVPDKEETWLVGDTGYIEKEGSVEKSNSYEDSYKSFIVENAVIDSGNGVISLEKKYENGDETSDNYWWDILALSEGTAEVTVSGRYLDDDGNAISGAEGQFTYQFTINVVSDVYSVDIESADGRYCTGPGKSIELTANFDHRSTQGADGDVVTYEWSFEKGGEFAEFVNEDDQVIESPSGKDVKVRFKDLPEGQNTINKHILVKAVVSNKGEEVADNTCGLRVASDYTELYPLKLTEEQANTPVGGSFEISPYLMRYTEYMPDGMRVYYPCSSPDTGREDVSIVYTTDVIGPVFTITRNTAEEIDFRIVAQPYGEEPVERIYHLNRIEEPMSEEELAELEAAKADAKDELDSYKDADDYRPAQQAELAVAITAGKAAIDAAKNKAGVASALAAAKAAIDEIKTDAEMTAEEEEAELAAAKEAAKSELDSYKNAADYREAQQAELAVAITAGKAAIDAAADEAGVASALAAAKAAIDEIKTAAQMDAEEAATLAEAQAAAKSELETYKNAADYREAQQAELAAAIAAGKDAIDAATDKAGVASALTAAKAAIDAIKTDAEMTAEEEAAELAAAKAEAKSELDSYKSAADYRPAQQEELAAAITAGKDAIDAATDKAGVASALAEAKAAIDEIKTDAEMDAEEAEALAAAQTAAKSDLDSYKNAADYRPAQQEELAAAIAAGKAAIDAASDEAGVASALAAAKAAIDEIKTDAEMTAEEAAAALAAAKTAAKSELETYKNAADYREAQQKELAAAIAAGKEAIDAAADEAGVASALAAAKAAIDKIKTAAQMDEEEAAAALAAAKTAAKNELAAYKSAADYRPAQQEELAAAITAGNAAIDAAADEAGVASALAAAKAAIDGIKTDAEMTAEEAAAALAAAKTAAKNELASYKSAADYRPEQQTELTNAITAGNATIEAAADETGVASALAAAKAAIDAIKTDEQLTAEEAAAALAAAKTAAKNELASYKNAADYREAQQAELANAITVGNAAIDAAADEAGVASALAAAKALIDEIKTDAEMTAEEAAKLAAAKAAAKNDLDSYKNAADYRPTQQEELAAAIAAGKAAIDAAADEAGVASALAAAKSEIDKIKTDAQLSEIEAAQAAAEAELQNIDTSAYSGSDKTNVENAIATARAAIKAATTVAAVNAAKAAALNTIKAQKTDTQKAEDAAAAQRAAAAAAAQTAPAEIMDLPVVKISKPKTAKKKITVKWKKVSKKNLKKISGIQIEVATDPAFANIVKSTTASKKKTSKVIKGLQSKTKYYVRIRAYAGGNHVSDWRSKNVKVK